uniref:Uncharacterized protein n=1 Tax=Rhizophora mucronata TaxID=61149 RepID=A0A2P2PJH6_RHIMU
MNFILMFLVEVTFFQYKLTPTANIHLSSSLLHFIISTLLFH